MRLLEVLAKTPLTLSRLIDDSHGTDYLTKHDSHGTDYVIFTHFVSHLKARFY